VAPATLRGARRVLAVRDVLGDGPVAPGLVVNAGVGSPEVGSAALGTAVELPVAAELPHAPREAVELGAGRPPRSRRGDLSRAVADLGAGL
jgi:hypothetical protein